MSDRPFRERRIPPEEVQRIMRRALELSSMDARQSEGKALTGAEIEARLHELGISPEIAQSALESNPAAIVASADGVIRVERQTELEGMLSPEHFERIAEAIQAVMKVPGRSSAVGNMLVWTPAGAMSEPSVTVHAKDGRTTIRYVESLANRGQQAIGTGLLSGFSAFGSGTVMFIAGVAIAKAADVSAASGAPIVLGSAALVALASAVGSFIGVKRMFVRRCEARSRFAEEVLVSVAGVVNAAMAATPTRRRVETGQATPIESDTDAEQVEVEAAAIREKRR